MNLVPDTPAESPDRAVVPLAVAEAPSFHPTDRLVATALGHATTSIEMLDRVVDDPYGVAADAMVLAAMMDDIVRHIVTIAPTDPELHGFGHRVVRFVLRLTDVVLSAQAVAEQAADAVEDPERFAAIERMLVTGRPLIESVHRAWWATVDRIGDPAAVDTSTTTDVLRASEFSRLMHPARHGEGAHPELISLDEHLRHVVAAALQLAGISGEVELRPMLRGVMAVAA